MGVACGGKGEQSQLWVSPEVCYQPKPEFIFHSATSAWEVLVVRV